MLYRTTIGAFLFALLMALPVRAADKPTPEGVEFFERKIRPLLVKHCYGCHSSEAKTVRGNLLLDSRAAILKGGSSGEVVVPGDPAGSLLIKAVRHVDEVKPMPPKAPLSAAEIADLEAWVKMGVPAPGTAAAATAPAIDLVKGREFWSFRPVKDPPIPAVKNLSWPLNSLDQFILAKLEEKNLRPVAVADPRTLIRRATFDLIGLPPTPEEIAEFEERFQAKPQAAYEHLIDRLLASPHYGERWGRHWLDVVRYADTAGDNSDYPIPQMYRYRNWVIRAVNHDMPYDQFVREQLAGDLMPAPSEQEKHDQLIATGYLANARRFGSYEDARYQWYLTYEDTIDNLGRTFLGLTINCCRCHDHKFDPLSQEDYYALYGFFQSTRYPWPGIELDKAPHDLVPLVPAQQVEASEKQRKEKLAAFDAEIKRLDGEKTDADKALKEAAKIEDEDERKDRIAAANKRVEELTKALKEARNSREVFAKKPLTYPTAYAVAEGKAEGQRKFGNACVQIKGDPEHLGKEVPRRFPTVLGGQTLNPEASGSGRLELANWITDPANPLSARVMVNRIWHYHFGKGLVPTPSDFGKQGKPPTHPELLDYLALRFIESGWSLKAMHRLIVLSRTYQLSGEDDAANAAVDVDNDFRWRFNRRRLDAESVRDAMLAVSGTLALSTGGPHPFPDQTTWDFTQHKPFKAVYDSNHRSVYLMTQRIQRHPFLALFDGPDTNASTARRVTSTTPLQALFLMNDPFVHEQARKLAGRLLEGRKDDGGCLEDAYLLLFGRPVTAAEKAGVKEYFVRIRDQLQASGVPPDQVPARAWESFVRVLFMSNEFVYVN